MVSRTGLIEDTADYGALLSISILCIAMVSQWRLAGITRK